MVQLQLERQPEQQEQRPFVVLRVWRLGLLSVLLFVLILMVWGVIFLV